MTQAVQDLNNSVRLVTNKRTFVRFHVYSTQGTHPTYARLRVQRGGNVLWLGPINPGGQINVRPAPDRGALNDAFLFELPSGYLQGSVSLTAELNPLTDWRGRNPVESNYGNNTVSTRVSFEQVPNVNVVLYTVGYKAGNTIYYPPGSHPTQMAGWLRRAFPLSTLRVWNRSYYYGAGIRQADGTLSQPNCGQVNSSLMAKKLWDIIFFWTNNVPFGARYYGMVDDRGGFMRGCAIGIPGFTSSGPTGTGTFGWDFDGSYGDWYGGHELAHDWGRQHANFCGAAGGAAYPYPGGRISPSLTGRDALYGFDIGTRAIYGPTWKDVMTYCTNQWVSDFTYEGLMTFFQRNLVLAQAEYRTQVEGDHLLVTGSIDPTTGQVDLQPLFIVPNAGGIQERTPGDYAIVLRNAAGAELARYPFTPQQGEGGAPLQPVPADARAVNLLFITELVPYVEDTTEVAIEGPGGVSKRITAGAAAPIVATLTPNGGEVLDGQTITVSWSASDPDGDPLTFNVQYSPDDGATWEMVAQNITGNSIDLAADNIVSGPASRFRVWVTDGIHTASAESAAPFVVPNRIPAVEIIAPESGQTAARGDTVLLAAHAYDVDTGVMPDSQLQWLSSVDGLLGNGAQLSSATLSAGLHTLTFRADDGVGGVVTATVQITVVENLTQAPALLDRLLAGPILVSFDPAAGVVTYTIHLDNQNVTNPIAWNAVVSEPWVRLSLDSGLTPDDTTAIFENTGLSAGIHTAEITFSSPAIPGETVVVRVESAVPPYRIYLPVAGK